jgi:hypothetical protein
MQASRALRMAPQMPLLAARTPALRFAAQFTPLRAQATLPLRVQAAAPLRARASLPLRAAEGKDDDGNPIGYRYRLEKENRESGGLVGWAKNHVR